MAMTIKELSADERNIVMHAIRQFGKGGHPYPDEQNINSFTSRFATQCLCRVLKRVELSGSARGQIEIIMTKLR